MAIALNPCQGDVDASDELLKDVFVRLTSPEDQARVWRAYSRNSFVRKDFDGAVRNIVQALRILGM